MESNDYYNLYIIVIDKLNFNTLFVLQICHLAESEAAQLVGSCQQYG